MPYRVWQKEYWLNYYYYIIGNRLGLLRLLREVWRTEIVWYTSWKLFFSPWNFKIFESSLKKKKFKSKLTEYSAKVSLQFHWINIQVTRRWSIVQMVSWSLSIEWPSFVLMNMGGLLNIRWASLSLGERVRVGLRTSDCSLGTSFYRLFSIRVYLIEPFSF